MSQERWDNLGGRFLLPALVATAGFGAFAATGLGQRTPLSLNENVVFLDAAHGGTDPGAHLGGSTEEKDVTLALAGKLRVALAAKGFTVVLARDGDATVSSEQRANVANHARPLVCVLLHASTSGAGAALAVSTLPAEPEARSPLLWATAQASYVLVSGGFRDAVATALNAASIKAVPLRASVPPIDWLTCAAVALEVEGSHVAEEAYQQRVADAVAQAVVAWKAVVAPPKAPAAAPAAAEPGRPAGAQPTKPANGVQP